MKIGYMKILTMFAILCCISLYYINLVTKVDYAKNLGMDAKEFKLKEISSIQYEEITETYGQDEKKHIRNALITYVYPDKLRIETNSGNKMVEIYNRDKYIYYDDINNKIRIKECFPPDAPYLTELERKMTRILKGGEYEFFGYEQMENKRVKVIGIKSKMDGKSYMHKLWISDINEVTLPFKEEFFIDNTVVSKKTYSYLKVNQSINSDIFGITSLPQTKIINDGVLPKYVDKIENVNKYLNFKAKFPKNLPSDILISEIAVIPPVNKPAFYCIYYKNNSRIYLNERTEGIDYSHNFYIGEIPCEAEFKNGKIKITWRQDDIYIVLEGDEKIAGDVISIAEDIAGGKLVIHDNVD